MSDYIRNHYIRQNDDGTWPPRSDVPDPVQWRPNPKLSSNRFPPVAPGMARDGDVVDLSEIPESLR